ncbi:MAG TPA: cytochrome P450 [Myxococcota bacterium]|nr:cytochrome P450 [Myxococcota bacterium]
MSAPPENPEIRLLDGTFYLGQPLEHYRWLRRHAPVYWDPSGGLWAVSRHSDVMAVSKNPEVFCSRMSSRPDAPAIPSMINLDDPQHRRRRNLVNKGFTPRRVDDHEPKIRAICRELIAAVAGKGRCDFVREIAAPLPMIVIGDLLGVAPEDRGKLLRWSDDLIAGTDAAAPPEVKLRMMTAATEYVQYAQRVIADRRSKPLQDDLMSVLVHAEIDGERLSDEDLIQESLLILVGGDETTRHVITGGMLALIQHPDARRALAANRTAIPTAVEEMLRWVTPIKNMNRTATVDTELGDQKIRAGEKVLLLYEAANRDERVFAEPDRFDPTRTPNDHVAFGGYGAHFCLGAALARLELRVMFEELLAGLPELALEPASPPRWRPSNFIVGIEHMPVVFAPRSH